jgi:hypothetical protein
MKKILGTALLSATVLTGFTLGTGEAHAASQAPSCDGMAPVSQLNSVTYADRTIRSFGAENTSALRCYTTKWAYSSLLKVGYTNRTHWTRTGVSGAAGTIYVSYRNTVDGRHIMLGVNNVSRGPGGWHATYTVRA